MCQIDFYMCDRSINFQKCSKNFIVYFRKYRNSILNKENYIVFSISTTEYKMKKNWFLMIFYFVWIYKKRRILPQTIPLEDAIWIEQCISSSINKGNAYILYINPHFSLYWNKYFLFTFLSQKKNLSALYSFMLISTRRKNRDWRKDSSFSGIKTLSIYVVPTQ